MKCKIALSAKEISQTVNKKLAEPPKPRQHLCSQQKYAILVIGHFLGVGCHTLSSFFGGWLTHVKLIMVCIKWFKTNINGLGY